MRELGAMLSDEAVHKCARAVVLHAVLAVQSALAGGLYEEVRGRACFYLRYTSVRVLLYCMPCSLFRVLSLGVSMKKSVVAHAFTCMAVKRAVMHCSWWPLWCFLNRSVSLDGRTGVNSTVSDTQPPPGHPLQLVSTGVTGQWQ